MIYDVAFVYQQFVDELPLTYEEFTNQWTLKFPKMYDTKVLSHAANHFGKTDLGHLYYKSINDKTLNNNVVVAFDSERDEIFGLY
jgi:hypothetical protein